MIRKTGVAIGLALFVLVGALVVNTLRFQPVQIASKRCALAYG
ncbi:MAG: hypothetical protein ABJO27_04390 [Pseudoruegeria sp.]